MYYNILFIVFLINKGIYINIIIININSNKKIYIKFLIVVYDEKLIVFLIIKLYILFK